MKVPRTYNSTIFNINSDKRLNEYIPSDPWSVWAFFRGWREIGAESGDNFQPRTPLIQKETFRSLLNASGEIRVPIFNNRKGHPILIKKELIDPLLNEPVDSNWKVFRDRYTVNYIETTDEGVLIDVDTMEDYLLIKETKRGKIDNGDS